MALDDVARLQAEVDCLRRNADGARDASNQRPAKMAKKSCGESFAVALHCAERSTSDLRNARRTR
jgi:hypothetical protein